MRTASISQTRQNLSSLLDWVKTSRQDVIIQNRGEAEAALIPFADYELLREAREGKRRRQAIAELHQLAYQVAEQNQDLSDAEALAIADEIARESVRNLTQTP